MNQRINPEYMSKSYYDHCRQCDHWGSSGCLATDAVQQEECPIREYLER